MKLAAVLVKIAGPLRNLDLSGKSEGSVAKADKKFMTLSKISMLNELEELGAISPQIAHKFAAVSDQQAEASLGRLDSLERARPTAKTVGRYAAIGGVAAPLAGAAANLIRGKSPFEGAGVKEKLREVAAKGVGGAITGGAVPFLRNSLDRKAEIGTLHNYLQERQA